MMRASECRSFVMIPLWLPVKEMASPPSSRMAMESNAIEMRSPAERSMSSSRRAGLWESCLALARSSSVVSPMAETTTHTAYPAARVRMMRSATARIFSGPATLLPPYFCTTIPAARWDASFSLVLMERADFPTLRPVQDDVKRYHANSRRARATFTSGAFSAR